jgi:dihydrofolate reductase
LCASLSTSSPQLTAEGTHFDTVVEGRNSFELGLKIGVQDAYPHLRHYVFSRTLQSEHVEVVATDPVEKVRELKQESGKDIWLVGGAALAGALYGEIDRQIVKLGPLTIGDGVPVDDALFLTYDRGGSAAPPAV